MENNNYPQPLSLSIRDLVETEGYRISDVLECFQFLFSEAKLSQMITWNMRNNVLDMLSNNAAPRRLPRETGFLETCQHTPELMRISEYVHPEADVLIRDVWCHGCGEVMESQQIA